MYQANAIVLFSLVINPFRISYIGCCVMETKRTKRKPSINWREKIITGMKAIAFLSALFELVKEVYKFLRDVGVF
jgi:small neutral amino acid transporter SnatA (MarC family)